MASLGDFDSILDDADIIHENKFPAQGQSAREANRFSQAIWLGKAYWLSRSEAHTEKFKEIVGDWISKNPPGGSADWNSSEEASLRAMNIIAGLLYFSGSSRIDDGFLIKLLSLLFEHGVFIRSNIARRRAAGSGVIVCLVGLLYLGLLFFDTREGKRWADFARSELELEISHNVFEDGSIPDDSINRHRLATEALTCAFVGLTENGFHVSHLFATRLESMFRFLTAATMRDGTVPETAEDQRVFRMSSKERLNDHRDLLAAGAAIFGIAEAGRAAGGFSELALFLLGGKGFEEYSSIPEGASNTSAIFRQGGRAFTRSEKDFASFQFRQRHGSKDKTGRDDLLSFTIAGKNQFLVNRGSDYSPVPAGREKTRVTIAHNSLLIDGVGQEDLASPDSRGPVRPELLGWQTGDEQDSVEAQYHLRSRKDEILTHKRNITFNKRQRTFRVEDDLLGEGIHTVDMSFHFAPGLRVLDLGRNFLAIEGEEFALMKFQHPFVLEDWNLSAGSDGRGVAKSARVTMEISFPARIETFIFITSSEDEMNYLLNRIRPGESA